MSEQDLLTELFFPAFFVSAIAWVCFLLFLRRHVPQGPMIRMPWLLAKRGGFIGWYGALSSGALILCGVVAILGQLAALVSRFNN